MKLVPYIHFNGNCREALEFYRDCLNGTIESMQTFGDAPAMKVDDSLKNHVLHSVFKFGDNILMASDTAGRTVVVGDNIRLSIDIPEAKTMDAIFNKMAVGGKITMPLQDTFWDARFGMLVDKFGIGWMFNCDEKKK
ncbi:MAG TPA: glyoxalase/bleomycin resistance/extradiol dioxygenase family protein [Bacteroidia bacterium]|jgi:PhnB protein|nr:glyoxalase/bleomycin resistance/extradiol dioxygenase family protein [Bacteroidia bacterium]